MTGAIPPELDGLLLRNGPNPILDPDPAAYHWFLGDGMLHGIELRGGKARYRNRWVRTERCVRGARRAGPGRRAASRERPRTASRTRTWSRSAASIYALVETSLPTEVRPDLSTVGPVDFGGRLRTPLTAHPKLDPVTGEMLFFGYDLFGPPYLRYHVIDAAR